MRSYRSAYAYGLHLVDLLCSVAVALATFAFTLMVAMPYQCWRITEVIKLAAFKIIAIMLPVCQESYETHGLSLDRRWRH